MKNITEKQYLRWASQQRYLYRKGKLSAYKTRKLEQIPGWKWDLQRTKRKARAVAS